MATSPRHAFCPISQQKTIFRYGARNNYTIAVFFGNLYRPGTAKSTDANFIATAYSDSGITAKGTLTHDGIVAADPAVLPLGSLIQVTGAGFYSGVYAVTDTGSKVEGRKIDIHMPSTHEAKEFGKKAVTVRVLQTGDNQRNGEEVTPKNGRPPAPSAAGNLP